MCLFILLRFLLSVWKVIPYTERNVLWNVLIVDHQVKKILCILVGQLESLCNAILDKTNLKFNLLALLVLTTRIGKCTASY